VAGSKHHDFIERYGALSRCLRAVATEAYAVVDVGSAQAKFLRHIGRHSRISQADLARATVTAPTLTGRALETLVQRGWVRRKRSLADRREYILELTASGQRMRERVEKARDGFVERVAAVLDDRDLDDFERIVTKILAALDVPAEAEPKR
jgi:DNA-binding MarR family transcriptional regulator